MQYADRPRRSNCPLLIAASVSVFALLLAGCVNDTGTGALTSTQIEEKLSTHEQRHVASKCNSADRLSASNLASQALNNKFTTYSEIEATLPAERKSAVVAELQARGSKLEALDQNLNAQCVSWSSCEFKSSTDKRSCSAQKHKFLDSEKQITAFTRDVDKIKIN